MHLLRRLIQAQNLTLGEARLTGQYIRAIREAIEIDPAILSTLHSYPAPPPHDPEARLRELRALFDRVLPPVQEEPIPPIPARSPLSDGDIQDRIEAAIRAIRRNRLSSEA